MKKFTKLLVANRGEIAVRVMRTARQMGYRTVAVYSTADQNALHVQCADESVYIGAAPAAESYLLADKVIEAARQVGADAIHPGYGFLSENAEFAEACAAADIIFVGPPADAIRLMGSKRLSKLAMLDSDVPCIPGYQGADQDDETLLSKAAEIGLPLMIKASAGGGGRGMRLVLDARDIQAQLNTARNEALSSFGSDEVILERALIEPRHIEIQVFADAHGNVVYLGERDCSIQRRHQKVVEESPSPFVDQDLRVRMGTAAVNAARACNYVGAGTVEFLVDSNRDFYFLEMNTRLQVEHPVTEMITGQDLVEWQLLVADGEKLPLSQSQVEYRGHAIEVRLYAEDPRQNFMPQTGKIVSWQPSTDNGVRIDSGIQQGQHVSPYYDPMLAKLITSGETREHATARLTNALRNTVLLGVNNNKRFLQSVLDLPAFRKGDVTTAFIEKEYPDNDYQKAQPSGLTLALAAMLFYRKSQLNPNYYRKVWSTAAPPENHLVLSFDGSDHPLVIGHRAENYIIQVADQSFDLHASHQQSVIGVCQATHAQQQLPVNFALSGNDLYMDDGSGHFQFKDNTLRPASAEVIGGDAQIKAPMDGAIVEILSAVGDTVEAGQVVAILEAMKMAHQLKAGVSGTIEEISVELGQQVKTRQLIVQIAEPE